jgi:hypothetical protein
VYIRRSVQKSLLKILYPRLYGNSLSRIVRRRAHDAITHGERNSSRIAVTSEVAGVSGETAWA